MPTAIAWTKTRHAIHQTTAGRWARKNADGKLRATDTGRKRRPMVRGAWSNGFRRRRWRDAFGGESTKVRRCAPFAAIFAPVPGWPCWRSRHWPAARRCRACCCRPSVRLSRRRPRIRRSDPGLPSRRWRLHPRWARRITITTWRWRRARCLATVGCPPRPCPCRRMSTRSSTAACASSRPVRLPSCRNAPFWRRSSSARIRRLDASLRRCRGFAATGRRRARGARLSWPE